MRPATLALNATTLGKNDPFQALTLARGAGLSAVELTAGRSDRAMVRPGMTPEEIKALQSRCAAHGLRILALGAHRDLSQETALAEFRTLIVHAACLHCRLITTAIPDGAPEDAYYEGLVKAARTAADAGVLICLENHGRKHGIGRSLLPFLRAGDAVALCYDTGNCYFYGNTPPQDDLPSCASHVAHIHLKDKAGPWNEWNFPALGEGYTNFPALFSCDTFSPGVTASIEVEFTPAGVSTEETERAVRRSALYLERLLHDMQ